MLLFYDVKDNIGNLLLFIVKKNSIIFLIALDVCMVFIK